MDYMNFAAYYDRLTFNVEYDKRAAKLHYLIRKYIRTETDGTLLTDLACGSGSLSEALAELGYDVIGVDNSPAMLGLAMEKKLMSGHSIQYLCQDMRELDMFGTIDVTVCMLDSLNHLETLEDWQQVFDKVSLFAQPGGLFLFDMNTLYKHRHVLADKIFLYDLEDVFCAWENRLLPDNATVEEQLTFFEPADGCYYRSDELIRETAYPEETIEALIQKAGLEFVAKFDADKDLDDPEDLSPVTDTTERILYVTRKPL
ncbi:MAG: class I SAM-dependent methyltransferase [Oscillospiraceae bacterium]|nr:class I SAM-dependent methyltransferase [Oscillospiraceae bacterium]